MRSSQATQEAQSNVHEALFDNINTASPPNAIHRPLITYLHPPHCHHHPPTRHICWHLCTEHHKASTPSPLLLQDEEFTLAQAIQEAQSKVHEALLDNINTGAALDALSSLIKATNQYLATKQAATTAAAAANGNDAATAAGLAAGGPQPLLLRKAAAYVTRILSVFGLLPVSI
jgi:hypothetical protein